MTTGAPTTAPQSAATRQATVHADGADEAWFWRLLADHYWERVPLTVVGCPLRLPVEEDELLRALRATVERRGTSCLASLGQHSGQHRRY